MFRIRLKMKKRLVLVVHGIGEQEPGECVGLLTASMPADLAAETSYDIERLEEEGGSDLDADGTPSDKPEIPTLFDCHSRRIRTETTDHIFAEVYWSNVVVTGRGTVDILISLIRVILGMGHIVRESAAVAYDNHPLMRRLCDAAIYCIHGPIAAMNTVLLIGALVASLARTYAGADLTQDFRWTLLIAVPLMCYGFYRLNKTVSYLWRSYWKWMILSAALMSALALSISHADYHIPPIDSQEQEIKEQQWRDRQAFCATGSGWEGTTRQILCDTGTALETLETRALSLVCVRVDLLAGGNRSCKNDLKGLYLLGVFILLAQQAVWLLTFVLMCLILMLHAFLWCRRTDASGRRKVPSLAPVALSSMALFWILLLCCIWAVGFFMDEQFTGNYQLFKAAFFLIWVNWGFALMIAAISALIFMLPYARWRRKIKPESYFSSDPKTGKIRPNPPPRLIVSIWIAVATMFCPVFLLSLAMISVMRDQAMMFHDVGWMNWLADLAYDYFRALLAVSALVGVALYGFREQLRVGIGLGSDVINYFRIRDYHPDPKKRVFFFRERIERRFIAVARAMVQRHNPDEVVIVSHSQGTVVALDVLRETGKIDDLRREGRSWKLITMGSPFTHIYHHYFLNAFVVPGRTQTGLDAWINIFRIDDFVGTHINPDPAQNWPEEVPVGRRGHTNYWVDIDVVPVLQKHLYS